VSLKYTRPTLLRYTLVSFSAAARLQRPTAV
jgi:hypothetical protein